MNLLRHLVTSRVEPRVEDMSWLAIVLCALSLLHPLCLEAAGATPVGQTVNLDYGIFHGLQNSTNGILSFRGIRYADPPIGNLRWRKPVSPPTSSMGDVNATDFAAKCISTTQKTVAAATSEDCLFGNVWVPAGTSVDGKLPVVVWFHGGGYQGGSSHDAPPERLLETSSSPFIFASFEYRLGQFGFLAGSQVHQDGNANAGLLDQEAALKWVQRYIGRFGGDPGRVTVWGQSAGAGSTMYHLIAYDGDNQGLFHAAIGDSPPLGSAPRYDSNFAEVVFQDFAQRAGCGGKSTETLSCLRSATSNQLAAAGSSLIAARPRTLYVFAPLIDGVYIRQPPIEALVSGKFARVPVLFGANTDDGADWSAKITDTNANTSTPSATQRTVYNFLQGQYLGLTETTFNASVGLYPVKEYNDSFSLQGQQMYGEMRYICTAFMISEIFSLAGLDAYQFRYMNPHLGSKHHFELQAFFEDPDIPPNENDEVLFKEMRQLWSSFVVSGQPVANTTKKWKTSTWTGRHRMLLRPGDITMEEISDDLATRCRFWHIVKSELQT